jgi:hypothetical protein
LLRCFRVGQELLHAIGEAFTQRGKTIAGDGRGLLFGFGRRGDYLLGLRIRLSIRRYNLCSLSKYRLLSRCGGSFFLRGSFGYVFG